MYLHRKCATCKKVGPVSTVRNRLEGDDVIRWSEDPFAAEIHEDDTPDWYCGSCLYDSLMEI